MVGRRFELDRLLGLFEEVRDSRGRFVYLEGEAGVGKTRLLDEFLRTIEGQDSGARILYGAYPPRSAGMGRGALAQAVTGHFGEVGLEARLAPFLPATPQLVSAYAATLTGIPLPEGAQPLSMEALQGVTCRLAGSLSRDRPLVWVAEDLHFSTREDRELLLSLAHGVHDKPILFIATSRPGLPAEELAHFRRPEHAVDIVLRRLATGEVEEMLREALGSDTLADGIAVPMADRSGGNPYFIFELLRGLADQGVLDRDTGGRAVLREDFTEMAVPSSIQSLLEERLSGMDTWHREVLDAAAVQGHRFDPGLLAGTLDRNRLEVLQTLAAIERGSGLVHGTGAAFQFDHNLLQEILYASQPPLLRREYHARLARAYLEQEGLPDAATGEVGGDQAVFLALNFLKGGEKERGLTHVLGAMDHLLSLYRNDDLLELADLALSVVEAGDPSLRCRIRLGMAKSLNLGGLREAQREAIVDALAAAAAAEDPLLVASALLARGELLVNLSKFSDGRVVLEQALQLATKHGEAGVELAALKQLATVSLLTGDPREARGFFERLAGRSREVGDRKFEADAYAGLSGVDRAQGRYESARENLAHQIRIDRAAGDREGEAAAESGLGALALAQAEYDEALGHFERQLALERKIGHRRAEGIALQNMGNARHGAGRLEEAQRYYEQSIALLEETGDRMTRIVPVSNLALLMRQQGRLQEARDRLTGVLGLAREVGSRFYEARTAQILGETCCWLGRFEEALEPLETSRACFAELGNRNREARSRCLMGSACLALARYARAREALEAARSAFEDLEDRSGTAEALIHLGTLALETGRLEEAEAAFLRCGEICREAGRGVNDGTLISCRGHLARARGNIEEARRLYGEALDLERDRGDPHPIASVALALGRLLLESGNAEEATPLLEEARCREPGGEGVHLGSLPSALLAAAGKIDPSAVEVVVDAPLAVQAETHLALHRAGGSGDHLRVVRELVGLMAASLPSGEREAFRRWNPLACAVTESDHD